jgi:hypothetical protein
MPVSDQQHTTPSTVDGDGVRIIRERPPMHWRSRFLRVLVATLIGTWIGCMALRSPLLRPAIDRSAGVSTPAVPAADVADPKAMNMQADMPRPAATTAAPAAATRTAASNPADWRTGDANDIATYVSPTDPEPTAAELIQALRDSGETGGIAAFNPPGTSPPLLGLAVPEEFELPEGYVRHHQVTDDGEPIEAILMFSPDYVFRDASGAVIPIPEDRVVPADMAPPGLPIRPIEIPPPPGE